MSSAILLVHIWLTHQQFTIPRGHLERFQFGTLVFLDLVIHRCYGSIHLSLLTKSNPRRSNNIKSWLSWVTKAEHYWQSTLTMKAHLLVIFTVAYLQAVEPSQKVRNNNEYWSYLSQSALWKDLSDTPESVWLLCVFHRLAYLTAYLVFQELQAYQALTVVTG